MLLKEALLKAANILKTANIETPALDAGVILYHVIGKDRAYLYAHGEYELSHAEETALFQFIRERAAGKPLQYITRHQEFMSLDFLVSEGVLIPRADTEVLVETVIRHVSRIKDRSVHILDIGTGSGCIAVSLAHYVNNSVITALDISPDALAIARKNADRIGVADKIRFITGNVLGDSNWNLNTDMLFDVIASNPPYIPSDDIRELQVEVRDYEPATALDGGKDGLNFYRRIVRGAGEFLRPGGMLAFEVGFNQAHDVARLMHEKYDSIKVIKDLAGIERVVTGLLAD